MNSLHYCPGSDFAVTQRRANVINRQSLLTKLTAPVLRIPDLPKALAARVFLEERKLFFLETFLFNGTRVVQSQNDVGRGVIEMQAVELAIF